LPRTTIQYGAGARAFHWITAVLVLAAFIWSAGGPEGRVYSPERAGELLIHETLGLAVFLLTALRLAWRAVDLSPASQPIAPWMRWSSQIAHWVLFALLLLVPVTAIVGAWQEGHPVTIFGIGAVGPLLSPLYDFGASLAEFHTWLGDALIWLAGFHALAALYHHFVLRDRVLVTMLPVSTEHRRQPGGG
jgi:cytochrome b561